MLSPLQEQVAEIIAGLEEAADFALAGGAALISRGAVQRQTKDLDFFGLTTDAVDRLLPAVEHALQAAGLGVRRVQDNPGFARLLIEGVSDRTEVDLAADARLFPVEPGKPAPALSGEELAVDKALAVFGRAEARDFVGLPRRREAVRSRSTLRACGRGGSRLHTGDVRRHAQRDPPSARQEFEIDDAGFQRLTREVEEWREQATSLGDQSDRVRE